MSINTDLYARLVADAGLVAEGLASSIYHNVAPLSANLPYLVYQKIAGAREHAMSGPVGLVQSRYQLVSWADDPLEAETIADKARLAMDGFKGTMGSTQVRGVFLENEVENSVGPSDGSDALKHSVLLDFVIWYQESTT